MDENPGDDRDINRSGHPQGTPTDRADSPVHEQEPLTGSGASRRQVSPARGERHQLTCTRSTEHHHRHLDSPRSTEHLSVSSRDRGTYADPSDVEPEITGAQRALDD